MFEPLDLRLGGRALLVGRLLVLEDRDLVSCPRLECGDLRFFFGGESRRVQRDTLQPFGLLPVDMLVERWTHPAKTCLSCGDGRSGSELLARKALEQRDVEPPGRLIVGEEIAFDAAAGGDIGILANETRTRIRCRDGRLCHHPTDAFGMSPVVAHCHLREDIGLPLLVGRGRIGLGNIERDIAATQRLEDHRGERCEPKPALDEADSEAEPLCHARDVRPLLDEMLEGEAFVCGVKRQPLEVLGEAGLGGIGADVVEDEAGNREIARQLVVGGERRERRETATAALDRELAAWLLRRGHDQVLKKAAGLDVGLELGIGSSIALPTHIARRRHELVEGDRLGHGTSP